MNIYQLQEYATFANLIIGAGILVLMAHKRLIRDFYFVVAFLTVNCLENIVSIPILFFRPEIGISKILAYNIYFLSHWILFFIEATLLVLVIYGVFRQAMKPLVGLHRAGKIIFRWVGGVSVALSVGLAMGPHASGYYYVTTLAGQTQQGINILILCLLLFVCFSTRYLGLTYRSHIFGVSLGLGLYATASLVESTWFANGVGQTVYSPVYAVSALAGCVAFLTWGTYFALPEPERKMILLPTTSPFFLWNRISEALGDEPGFVAIAGFKPHMLAPAELTVLTAASKWSRERELAREREAEEERAELEAETVGSHHALAMHSMAIPR